MKTFSSFLAVVAGLWLFLPHPVPAQVAAGIRAGVRLSGLSVKQPGAGSLDQPGIYLSLPLEWQITNILVLQPEVSYIQKGARWIDTYVNHQGQTPIKIQEETAIELDYLEAAFLVKAAGTQQKLSYFAGIGPYLGYRLSTRHRVSISAGAGWKGEQYPRPPGEAPSESDAPRTAYRLDAGLNFAAGWGILLGTDWRLVLEFQYQLGLRPVVDPLLTGGREANRGVSFQVGFLRQLDRRKGPTGPPVTFTHPMMR